MCARTLSSVLVGATATLLVAAHAPYSSFASASPRHQDQSETYADLRATAEAHYDERSYARAVEVYERALTLDLSDDQRSWVAFRLADSSWRAGARRDDDDAIERARSELDAIVERAADTPQQGVIRAEALASLGDSYWVGRHWYAIREAWPHYRRALAWWADSSDLEVARRRYLDIVWKIAQPLVEDGYYSYPSRKEYDEFDAADVFDDALRVATEAEDRARAHFLLAAALTYREWPTDPPARIARALETGLPATVGTAWRDDMLFVTAKWMSKHGNADRYVKDRWVYVPDHVRALELYRLLLAETRKGESPHYAQAERAVKTLIRPTVDISAPRTFLPGSEIVLDLRWRNAAQVELQLHHVGAPENLDLSRARYGDGEWPRAVELAPLPLLRTWSVDTQDDGRHRHGAQSLRLDEPLPAGAYIVEATVGGPDGWARSRALILVTDAALIVKRTSQEVLAYFGDAASGAPIEGAPVTLWAREYVDPTWSWISWQATTARDGTAVFPFDASRQWGRVIVAAGPHDRPSIVSDRRWRWPDAEQNKWSIYAFADRPAYRPGDTAQWKILARRSEGGALSTPADETLWYEIYGPSGTKVDEGRLTLNAFGAAWGELPLDDTMSLGTYQVRTHEWKGGEQLGSADLFRLEEFRLPEFKVTVAASKDADARPAPHRFGDTLEATVHAGYYSGGNVTNSTVQVSIHQQAFRHFWQPPREFDWYDDETAAERSRRSPAAFQAGANYVVERQTLTTDGDGNATVRFQTPVTSSHDVEYRIVARVTDASRRQIVGEHTVRVTRQRAFVYASARHVIYRPGDTVHVDLSAVDANDRDERAEGTVTVRREKGTANEKRRQILARQFAVEGTGGEPFTFIPTQPGRYQIQFGGRDADGTAVKASTEILVADDDRADIQYRFGDLAIILDQETYEVGEVATVMLTAASAGRHVLLSVERDGLVSHEVVHMRGTAKLVELELGTRHAPNIRIAGATITDYRIYADAKELVVVPTNEFLQVEVRSDSNEYLPGDTGALTVAVSDAAGQPVEAELALAVFDDAVTYIQSEMAGDPRRHFYGDRRPPGVTSVSSFQRGHFVHLAENDQGKLMDRLDPDSEGAAEDARRAKKARKRGRRLDGAEITGSAIRALGYIDSAPMYYDFDAFETVTVTGSSPIVTEEYMQSLPARTSSGRAAERIRSDFRATALWTPAVTTGPDGTATIEFTYPDSVTSWRAVARVATRGNAFGVGDADTRTDKPLIARLQTPRFLVAGDRATVSTVINNNTEEALSVVSELTVAGLELLDGEDGENATGETPPISAGDSGRTDWHVAANDPGPLTFTARANSSAHGDAVQHHLVAHDHGIDKLAYAAGALRTKETAATLWLPPDRQDDTLEASIHITPSLAVGLLDALPYLVDYPYGCTEQTMSRFVPAVITAGTMRDLGLSASDVLDRMFDKANVASDPSPPGRGEIKLSQLDRVTRASLQRLYDVQGYDGGWGWWDDQSSDHYMSAYVLWGLTLAREAGLAVDDETLANAARYLHAELVEEAANLDTLAWMLHAIATYEANQERRESADPQRPERAPEPHTIAAEAELRLARLAAFENLWQRRERLSAYSLALLTRSAADLGLEQRAQVLVRNLEELAIVDAPPGRLLLEDRDSSPPPASEATVHWGASNGWSYWADGGVESTSFALRALLAVDPDNPLIGPTANWLVKNRRGARWNNTRDTSIAVLALNEYLAASGEMLSDIEYEVSVNGTTVAHERIAASDVLRAPRGITVDRDLLVDGDNEIRFLRRDGDGPLYFAAQATYLSLEEPVTAAGSGVFVRRQYNRMVGRQTLLNGYAYDRAALQDGDTVVSGERVEVVLTIEASNNYEYLLFEDLKPAGFEAVDQQSGEFLIIQTVDGPLAADRHYDDNEDGPGRRMWGHRELRDRKVAFFISRLGQGWWEIRYYLRAETPGEFHALPTLAEAMYVPEIRANGRELRLRVADQ